MRSEPKQVLKAMLAAKGDRIVRDPELCEALLRDGCGECRKEIAILVNTVKCGAAHEVYSSSAPYASLRARLVQRVQDDQGLSAEAAAWGIDTWREALTGSAQQEQTPPAPPKVEEPRPAQRVDNVAPMLGMPPAADVIRDWRSGQTTPVIERAMRFIKENAGDFANGGPEQLIQRLVAYGIPADIAEQMLLKAVPAAGGSTLAGGIGMFIMGIFATAMDGEIWSRLLIVAGVGMTVFALYQRHRWRKWVMEIALRNTGAA